MALKNTTDPQVATDALQTWLSAKLPDATDIVVRNVNTPSSAGLSTETILFDASWNEGGRAREEQLVARVAPAGEGVFPTYDLTTEFKVLDALGTHTGVPVPKVWWVEEDPTAFGGPFLIMSRIDGRVPADDPPFTATGWVLDLAPEDRRKVVDNSLRVMADIHAADWRGIGLESLAPEDGETPFGRQLTTWRSYFDWARAGDANPTVEAGFAWLAEHRPQDEGETVLNWGDARVGNLLYGDDLAVQGVLDWEMVDLGNREIEVGWWLFILRHHTEGIGVPVPEGIPSREEIVATYEAASGVTLRDVDYYEVFAAVRLAAIMHRAGNLMVELGMLPPDAPMRLNNPASQLLAKLLGLEAPSGDAQSFIGNRG